MNRRSFFSAGAALVLASGVAYSVPDKAVICWSGWRTSQTNNMIVGWHSAHFKEPLILPTDPGQVFVFGYHHFASMVLSKAGLERHKAPGARRAFGYGKGYEFDISGSICLEENMEALAAWNDQSDLDRIFSQEKMESLNSLRDFLATLEPEWGNALIIG